MHTASKVNDERPIQIFVPDESGVNTRARRMVNAEVTQLFVSAKEITFLLIDH